MADGGFVLIPGPLTRSQSGHRFGAAIANSHTSLVQVYQWISLEGYPS